MIRPPSETVTAEPDRLVGGTAADVVVQLTAGGQAPRIAAGAGPVAEHLS